MSKYVIAKIFSDHKVVFFKHISTWILTKYKNRVFKVRFYVKMQHLYD